MVRLPCCGHCTSGARIFSFCGGSSVAHHTLRIRLISHVTHGVKDILKLGLSLVRTVSLNRSVNRAPFKRTNREFLGRLLRTRANECFGRGIRDIHILSGLFRHGVDLRALSNILYRGNRFRRRRCHPTCNGAFTRFSGDVLSYYRGNNSTVSGLIPTALRKYIIHVYSVVTCLKGSERSTHITGVVPHSCGFRDRFVNTRGTTVVGGLAISVVRGDCNGSCVLLDPNTCSSLGHTGRRGCSIVCGGRRVGERCGRVVEPVFTRLCCGLLSRIGDNDRNDVVCHRRVGFVIRTRGCCGRKSCLTRGPGLVITSFVTDVASSCFVTLRRGLFPNDGCGVGCGSCFDRSGT